MAPRIQWSDQLIKDEFIVPRLEDHLIDELFYQEDEIGEMRHTAFMVECGLEEDPPDGPDVPPVPWGDMLLKQHEEQRRNNITASDDEYTVLKPVSEDSSDDDSIGRSERNLPNRSRSTDDIDTLAIELTTTPKASPRRRIPKRTTSTPLDLYVVNGESSPASPYGQISPASPAKGSVLADRRSSKRPPARSVSEIKPERTDRPQRSVPSRNRLSHTRSGTNHEMVAAAAKAKEKMNADKPRSVPSRNRLSHTRSGTNHEMVAAAARAKENMNADKDDKKPKVIPNRRLSQTRSGTSHMAAAAIRAKMELNAEREREQEKETNSVVPPNSPSVLQRTRAIEIAREDKSSRQSLIRRSLVATRSGTLHGMRKKLEASEQNESDEETRIVYKNGKKTLVRKDEFKETESKLKSKSNSKSDDSGGDKKTKGRIVYRNGKKEIIKANSGSSSDNSDDDFLGDIVRDSDHDSAVGSVISISTDDSNRPKSSSFPKEKKPAIPKSVDHSISLQTRDTSLKKDDSDDDIGSGIISPPTSSTSLDSQPTSSRSISLKDGTKKKKKKKKKKDDDSNAIPSDSMSSKKKKKKKKEKESSDQHDSSSSLVHSSPSSKRANRKKPDKKRDDDLSPSEFKIGKHEGLTSRPDDFLGAQASATRKKKKDKVAVGNSKKTGGDSRPDDWLGSGKTQKRTWRVKTKTPDD